MSEKNVKAIIKLSHYFLATTPKAQSIKEKTWEIRPHQKIILRKWKDKQQTGTKYLQTYTQ